MIFGDSHIEQLAGEFGIETVCRIPVEPALAANCDSGTIELFEGDWLEPIADVIEKL